MWSPGFEANPNSPAGEMQGFWWFTGRGRDAREPEARECQLKVGRVGRLMFASARLQPFGQTWTAGRTRLVGPS